MIHRNLFGSIFVMNVCLGATLVVGCSNDVGSLLRIRSKSSRNVYAALQDMRHNEKPIESVCAESHEENECVERVPQTFKDSLKQTCEQLKREQAIAYKEWVPFLVLRLTDAFMLHRITLVDIGIDVDCADYRGCSLLHYAVMGRSDDVVKKLLQQGACVNIKNNGGYTPLHIACAIGAHSIISRLINAQANIYAKNDVGKTPLHVAVEHDQTNAVMLMTGQKDFNLEVEDNAGQTPLFIAVKRLNLPISAALQSAGADLEHKDKFGRRAFDVYVNEANCTGKESFVQALKRVVACDKTAASSWIEDGE